MVRVRAWVAGMLLGAALAPGAVRAQDVAGFYHGKTLRLVISTSTGNGYDFYGRTVARHLPRHLPGHPSMLPQNMPGAGGITGANYLYNLAEKDGTVIGLVQNTVPFEPLYDNKAARFDATRFNFLGSPNSEVSLLILWHTVPVDSIADLQKREVTMAASGANSTPAFFGRLFNELLHTRMRIISGYPGQGEAFLAMENGEADGYPTTFWSSLKTLRPNWLEQKQVKLLMQYAGEPSPDLKTVPFGPDLAANEEDRQLFLLAATPLTVGRPFLAPPAVPAERVAALRAAFSAMFADPDFQADLKKQNLDQDSPKSGAELDAIVTRMYASPAPVIQRLRKIYGTEH
jgi:tripartite-type tricarboxylate transporter receptor subunit TctC